MRLFWTILFAASAVFSTAVFIYAPFNPEGGYWFLDNIATLGESVDELFLIILGLTGVVFVGYMAFFVYATYKYAERPDDQRPAWYSHGNVKLEVIWSAIPAVILFFLAVYQMDAWAKIKFQSQQPDVPVLAEVTGRQFQWKIRYPGPDQEMHTHDDLFLVNELHMVKDEDTLIHLTAEDVLHAFFVPAMRIKQDAVPGLKIPVWFDADTSGTHELVCAELCGWGHYKMRAEIIVHETREDFESWMNQAIQEQAEDGFDESSQIPATAPQVTGTTSPGSAMAVATASTP